MSYWVFVDNIFLWIFVPLLRGDIKWAAILLLLLFFLTFIVGPFSCIANVIFAAFYNKLYITDQIEKGYVPATEDARSWIINSGILPNSAAISDDNIVASTVADAARQIENDVADVSTSVMSNV